MARLSLIGSAFTTLVVGLTLLACGAQDNGLNKPPDGVIGAGGNGGNNGGSSNPGLTATGGGYVISSGTGGSTDCVGTSSGCKAQKPEGCGDGINNQNGIEVCDDGNTLAGDGCNGACKVERNWDCPKDKTVGDCKRQVICGDGNVGAGEVCDDKNTTDNDGCNSTCTVQDAAFTCVPGEACVRVSKCGNARIESGENCDDGQDPPASGDGCSATCQLEDGWVCPKPGSPCKAAPRCGDGVVTGARNEVCDDGNTSDGDGCSSDCLVKGEGCVCSPGELCTCPTIECGNGKVEGSEACDDGNTSEEEDGCNSSCTVEQGYTCPFSGAPCVPDCGDGVVMAPMEQCDPGVQATNMDQACTSTCKWADGWACGGSPVTCHQTKCGDGNKEGTEGCDDGNTTPGDGCSPTCHAEPQCSSATGTCESKCGDGIVMPAQPDGPVMPGGACDDGNDVSGDGCSSDCKVEPGYQCEQAAITAETMTVPMTVRDFAPGGDFEPSATGEFMAVPGLVKDTLDNEGKPVASGVGDGYITSAASFADWYRKGVWSKNTTLTLYANGSGGYVNRYGANGEKWRILSGREEHWCGPVGQEVLDDAGDPMPCTYCAWDDPATPGCDNNQQTDCQKDPNYLECVIVNNVYHGIYLEAEFDGNPAFFPADDAPNPAPTAIGQIAPPFGNWEDEPGAKKHNYSFTTEVRYWFGYVASKKYTLDFMGDDDVWVFVNRKLAVDIGGIHTPVSGTITLNANGGGTATVTQVTDCGTAGGTACAKTTKTVNLGMEDGGVYEIALFQAERQTRASTYKLTLSGFNDSASSCKAICGDGVVSPGEQCDNGTDKNIGGYNNCTPDCLLGPYCGDGTADPEEECDNGKNDAEYGTSGGCAPGCKLPASCGDGRLQVEWGEDCDEGENNLTSTDPNTAYGGLCLATCQRGGYCGDGQLNGPETCDDGANDGTYGSCTPECTPAPKCGDGNLDSDYGEECEPDPNVLPENDPCSTGCRLKGGCGDGEVKPPEQCDEGELFNLGEYGGCAPSCVFGPYCGDGVMNGPEKCDDGILDGAYGGCTAQCQLGPYCGDNHVDPEGNEDCDHGASNEIDGLCSDTCKNIIYVPG